MADKKNLKAYYNNLAKLFAKSGPIQYKQIANKIAPPGTNQMPVGTAAAFLKNAYNSFATHMAQYGTYSRMARYSDYASMESMSEISAALDIYADEACVRNEYGDLFAIESSNRKIKELLEDLFYETLNLEFNAWHWIRNMAKYGDQFLFVDHHPDYGVLNALPMPVNEVERDEGYDDNDPTAYRYRWVTQGNKPMDNWEVIHFRLLGNDAFLPFGASMIEPARRVWRQLVLLEDAVMTYRIVRSPERRVFYVDVGGIGPQDIKKYMEKFKTELKRNQIIDASSGRADLRYNPLSAEEDFFVPVRGEMQGSRIETLPGGQYTGDVDDLMYFQNKLFASLKIPKSYLGYEGDMGSKSGLSQQDVRFANTIKRIQQVFIAELNKLAIIHLFSAKDIDFDEITNFEIKMANPSSIAEMQRLELWRTKFEVASMATEGLLDKHFIYARLLSLSNEEIEGINEGRKNDRILDMVIENLQPPEMSAGEETAPEPEEEAPEPGGEEEVPPEEPAPTSPEAGGRDDAGLPPPPSEEPITAARDPMRQTAAPNELLGKKKKIKNRSTMPDLYNHVFNTKKTAMDVKRNRSELNRLARNPFGESRGGEDEDAIFERQKKSLKKIVKDLEESEGFLGKTRQKKVITD